MKDPFGSGLAAAWDDSFPDLPTLNKGPSDFIVARVEKVRAASAGRAMGALESIPSTAVLLLGSAGAGKTHLFNRLRSQLGQRTVIVHLRPELGTDISLRSALSGVLDSLLRRTSAEEYRQHDIITGALIAWSAGHPEQFPLLQVETARNGGREEQRVIIERAVARFCESHHDVRRDFLEGLLRLSFLPDGREKWALAAWLSGREPSAEQLELLGRKSELDDSGVIEALKTLGLVAAFVTPIVLVFDQLENLVEEDESGRRIHDYARVVNALRDNVRGLVIVQMAVESEWERRIRPVLKGGLRDRIEEHAKMLSFPNPDEKRALIRLWVEQIPVAERGLEFPWPFTAAKVEEWVTTPGLTPRMLMRECAEEFAAMSDGAGARREAPVAVSAAEASVTRDEWLGGVWRRYVDEARAAISEAAERCTGVDAERIEGALRCLLGLAPDVRATRVETKRLRAIRAVHRELATTIVVVQHRHHRSMEAAIRNALLASATDRVLFVREASAAIPPTWKVVGEQIRKLAEHRPGASLSKVARAISGTNWNGYLFFSLQRRTRKGAGEAGA